MACLSRSAPLNPVAAVALAAVAGGLAVYAYAVAALVAHGRLAALAKPRSLSGALWRGAWMPACGCTALAHARRLDSPQRAPFLVASYAASPLLVLAALVVAGWLAALAVAALALAFALASALVRSGERPRTRLDDLLIRRDAAPMRDAVPYLASFGAPGLGVGALVGLARLGPAWVAGASVAALAFLLAPPARDVAEDHGARFASQLRALFVAFALGAGVVTALLAA